jgi:8-oxo-dGTP diphosphatase
MNLVHAGSVGLIPVVALALVDGEGRVLLHRRAPGKHHGLLWEFPGGKVEPGEGAAQAMLREAQEELGITPEAQSLAPVSFAQSAGQAHLILLYACRHWQGRPQALEWPQAAHEEGLGEGIAWFTPADLAALAQGEDMPPLDRPLARALLRWLAQEAAEG